jgi:hypothetical protein
LQNKREQIMRWFAWWAMLGCLVMAGCGQSPSTAVAPAIRLLQNTHTLHDATFTVTFTSDSAHGTGTGTLTTDPAFAALTLGGNQQVIIDAPDDIIYGRLTNDKLWSVLNDADNGVYVNYDTNIWHPWDMQSATLVGSETLGGTAAWHLRGSITATLFDANGNTVLAPGTEDLWLRQSDNLPLQLVKHAKQSGTAPNGIAFTVSLDATYHFTAWNTGATIKLPTENEIAASG